MLKITTSRSRSAPLYITSDKGTISLVFETELREVRSRLFRSPIARTVAPIAVYTIGEGGVTRHAVKGKRRLLIATLILFLAVGPALFLIGCLKGRYVPKRRVREL